MNLDALKNTDRTYWVPFGSEGEKVLVRYISKDELRTLLKQATIRKFVNHQAVEEYDARKADILLGNAAIKDWQGFTFGDEPVPCNAENIELLMTRWSAFSKFINDAVTDLDLLVSAEKDATAKN